MLIRHFAFFYYLCYFNSGYWCSIFTSRADCEIKGRVIRVGRGGDHYGVLCSSIVCTSRVCSRACFGIIGNFLLR